MQVLEVLGAFCCGLVVVYFVRRWHSEAHTYQDKVFTAITAAILVGGVLLFLGSAIRPATSWPLEFWAYPVGLAVALFLWRERDESKEQFTFKIVVTLLVGVGIVSLVLPDSWIPKPFAGIFRSVGEAVFIAGALAATVDHYIKQRTYREISADAFKYLIGYALPEEFQDRIRELVTNSDLIRRDCTIAWNLHPTAESPEVFDLEYSVIYKLQNVSKRRASYQFKTSKAVGDDQESQVTRLWGKFPNGRGNYEKTGPTLTPGAADPSGRRWILGDQVWVDAENIRHGLDFKVGVDYKSHLRRQFDYHVFKKPTLGASVAIEHPMDFQVFLSPDPGEAPEVEIKRDGRCVTTWGYRRLMFNEDAIFVR